MDIATTERRWESVISMLLITVGHCDNLLHKSNLPMSPPPVDDDPHRRLLLLSSSSLSDRIPSTTPGAEPPRDARDSGSARSHSTHLETSSSNRP